MTLKDAKDIENNVVKVGEKLLNESQPVKQADDVTKTEMDPHTNKLVNKLSNAPIYSGTYYCYSITKIKVLIINVIILKLFN